MSNLSHFFKIKSDFIKRKILSKLQNEKKMEIIRYCKKIQAMIGLSISNYKKFNKKIKIEIEYENYVNEENNNYIYCYSLNKGKKFSEFFSNDKIYKKIKILIENDVESFEKLFAGCGSIKKINFIRFNRTDIKNMKKMFSECLLLEKINFSNFKTKNVTDMSYMFKGCESLKEIDLRNFNTNNVINMSYMFSNCVSLKKLDISNFNTTKV